MNIFSHFSLKKHNSFGFDVYADTYVELNTFEDIVDFINNEIKKYPKYMILGGGSNVLFLQDYKGLVVSVKNTGIEIIEKENNTVWVKVAAGENWSELVDYCTDSGYYGLQNLALIPGNAGSAPIQNIGAYGSEIKDVLVCVEGIYLDSGIKTTFQQKQCNFGYRESIFKKELKNKFLITSITLELNRNNQIQLTYRTLIDEFNKRDIENPTATQVRDTVKNIRQAKLPDPEILGNAGSFFKNPVVTNQFFSNLIANYPDIISFPQTDGNVKLAAGWLIEKCGWKGYISGDAGVHVNQALVLVNYGNATGSEIYKLAQNIIVSVHNRFNVKLELEVNCID